MLASQARWTTPGSWRGLLRCRASFRRVGLLLTSVLTTAAFAQTAPELFIFKPGTPILADEMNANFQLLRDHVTNALGIADLTSGDLEELANLVEQLQALVTSDERNGSSLEYEWDGTRLGVRHEGDEEFVYVDLRGVAGPQGERGETGDPGPTGADGADGRNLEFHWNGTQLGVRYVGDTAYTYTDLEGPPGAGDPNYSIGAGLYLGANDTLSLDASQTLPDCIMSETLQRNGGLWHCVPTPPGHDYYFGADNPNGQNVPDGRSIAGCVLGDIWLTAAIVSHGVEADGRLLPISHNMALFSLHGNTYGGDGVTTFTLPDLRDAAPKSRNGGSAVHYVICIYGQYPSWDTD